MTIVKKLTNKPIKLVIASGIMGLSMLGGTFAPLSSALALCSGYACDDTSPASTNCDDDGVVKKTTYISNQYSPYQQFAKVQLMYSAACKTIWSRVVLLENEYGGARIHVHQYATRKHLTPSAFWEYRNTVLEHDDLYNVGTYAYSKQLYLPPSGTEGWAARAYADAVSTPDCSISGHLCYAQYDISTAYWSR